MLFILNKDSSIFTMEDLIKTLETIEAKKIMEVINPRAPSADLDIILAWVPVAESKLSYLFESNEYINAVISFFCFQNN